MRKSAFPRTLQILAGLRWTGKLTVESRVGPDLFQVQFDAEDPKSYGERFVYDRTQLSATQVQKWTGQDPNEWEKALA